jgi:hypothetical protein
MNAVFADELDGKLAGQHKKLFQQLMPPSLDVLERTIELTTSSPGPLSLSLLRFAELFYVLLLAVLCIMPFTAF